MSRQTTKLRRQDLFGFVPGGHVLDTEMAYGGYDPQDWHQRRGGPVVAAEESYGDEDDHFSLHGEDDDVEFGGDLEDVPLFGGEEKGDKVDDQLDSILEDMDKEDFGEYGADPMAVAPGAEGVREDLADVIRDGIRNSFVGESTASPDSWTALFRRNADWVSDKFEQFSNPGDIEEIAQALLADPGFGQWYQLSEDDHKAMVSAAINYAAIPGIEHQLDDAVLAAWNEGWANFSASDAAQILWSLFRDSKKTVYAAFAELIVFGNLMQMIGVDPENADQMFNSRAVFLAVCLKAGFPVDAYIAEAITKQGQAIVATVGAANYAQSADLSSRTAPEAEALAEQLVAPPVQSLPDSGYRMPPPEQILAFGYGVTILGSLAGIF